MSIQSALGLRKLNDRHRRAAHLMVQGLTFCEISQEVGYHPDHWSRLARHSPLFQTYLDACRAVAENIYLTSTERLSTAAIERKLETLLARQRRRQERQQRYRQGKSGTLEPELPVIETVGATSAPESSAPVAQRLTPGQIADLEDEVARLRAELIELNRGVGMSPDIWSVAPEHGVPLQDGRGMSGRIRRSGR